MHISDVEKRNLLRSAVDVVISHSGSPNAQVSGGDEYYPRLLEVVYQKLLELAEKS